MELKYPINPCKSVFTSYNVSSYTKPVAGPATFIVLYFSLPQYAAPDKYTLVSAWLWSYAIAKKFVSIPNKNIDHIYTI